MKTSSIIVLCFFSFFLLPFSVQAQSDSLKREGEASQKVRFGKKMQWVPGSADPKTKKGEGEFPEFGKKFQVISAPKDSSSPGPTKGIRFGKKMDTIRARKR